MEISSAGDSKGNFVHNPGFRGVNYSSMSMENSFKDGGAQQRSMQTGGDFNVSMNIPNAQYSSESSMSMAANTQDNIPPNNPQNYGENYNYNQFYNDMSATGSEVSQHYMSPGGAIRPYHMNKTGHVMGKNDLNLPNNYNYQNYDPRPMSGQSISQQGGPTPTLNQLLQTSSAAPQRMQQSYSDANPMMMGHQPGGMEGSPMQLTTQGAVSGSGSGSGWSTDGQIQGNYHHQAMMNRMRGVQKGPVDGVEELRFDASSPNTGGSWGMSKTQHKSQVSPAGSRSGTPNSIPGMTGVNSTAHNHGTMPPPQPVYNGLGPQMGGQNEMVPNSMYGNMNQNISSNTGMYSEGMSMSGGQGMYNSNTVTNSMSNSISSQEMKGLPQQMPGQQQLSYGQRKGAQTAAQAAAHAVIVAAANQSSTRPPFVPGGNSIGGSPMMENMPTAGTEATASVAHGGMPQHRPHLPQMQQSGQMYPVNNTGFAGVSNSQPSVDSQLLNSNSSSGSGSNAMTNGMHSGASPPIKQEPGLHLSESNSSISNEAPTAIASQSDSADTTLDTTGQKTKTNSSDINIKIEGSSSASSATGTTEALLRNENSQDSNLSQVSQDSLKSDDGLPMEKTKHKDSCPSTPTPVNTVVLSPTNVSQSSFHDDFDSISSPSWPGTPSSITSQVCKPNLTDFMVKIYDMGDEPGRKPFLDRLFSYMEERGCPITTSPMINKQPIDLYQMYLIVKEKGGLLEITKNKKWKEVSSALNIGSSNSAGFTVRKNYIKYIFAYECKYDRGGMDPQPVLSQLESGTLATKKKTSQQLLPAAPANGPEDIMDPFSSNIMPPNQTIGPNNCLPSAASALGNSNMPIRSMVNTHGMNSYESISVEDPFSDQHNKAASNRTSYGMPQGPSPGPGPGSGAGMGTRPPSYGSSMPQQGMMMPGSGSLNPTSMSGQQHYMGHSSTGAMNQSASSGSYYDPMSHEQLGPYNRGGYGTPHGSSVPGSTMMNRPPAFSSPSVGPRFENNLSNSPNSAMVSSQYGMRGPVPKPYASHAQSVPYNMDQSFPKPRMPEPTSNFGAPDSSSHMGMPHHRMPGSMTGPSAGHMQGPVPVNSGMGHSPAVSGSMRGPSPGPLTGFGPGNLPTPNPNIPVPTAYSNQKMSTGPTGPPLVQRPPHSNNQMMMSAQMSDNILGPAPSVSQFSHSKTPERDKMFYSSPNKGQQRPHYMQQKEPLFPHDSTEAIKPVYAKRKKLTSRDLGVVDPWQIMMALKSGLMAESTWALDTLAIMLFDDSTVTYFGLKHLPGLLDVLLDHFKKYLIEVFQDFEELADLQIASEQPENKKSDEETDSPEKSTKLLEGENYTNITRYGRNVITEENTVDPGLQDPKIWDNWSVSESEDVSQINSQDLTYIVTRFEPDDYLDLMRKRFSWREKIEGDDDEDVDEAIEDLPAPDIKNESEELLQNAADVKVKNKVCDDDDPPELKQENESDETNEPQSCVKTELKTRYVFSSLWNKSNDKDPSRKRRLEDDVYEEPYIRDDSPLCLVTASQQDLTRRCISISNILRNLSFIPGNDSEMSSHPIMLYILGKMLLLLHRQVLAGTTDLLQDSSAMNSETSKQSSTDINTSNNDSIKKDNTKSELQQRSNTHQDWWWDCLQHLRENTFVILANIAGQLQLSNFPEEICLPIMDGLLYWATCPAAYAVDPLPSMSQSSPLSPRRLVLETMCKLCVHDTNIDILLVTPPFSRMQTFISTLLKLFANKLDQVSREFSLVLLSSIVLADSVAARLIALHEPSIALLLDFIETAERNAIQIVNRQGMNTLRDNPEMMGTSLDMMRRAASLLLQISLVEENKHLIKHFEDKLLSLVMSQFLDSNVASILSDVLFQSSH